MTILVTGAAGFIGSHLCDHLLARDETLVGLDSFKVHYDPNIKYSNIESARKHPNLR